VIDLTVRKPGQPLKLNNEIKSIIYEYVSKGNYINVACQAAGIDNSTFSHWQQRAKDFNDYIYNNNIDTDNLVLDVNDRLYNNYELWQFFNELKRAQAEAEAHHVSNLIKASDAGPQFWAASATYLERKHPDRWAKREALDDALKAGTELLQAISARIKAIQSDIPVSPPIPSDTKLLNP
jgi:hypothetical protein